MNLFEDSEGGEINSKLIHRFHSHALSMASDAAALKEKKVLIGLKSENYYGLGLD